MNLPAPSLPQNPRRDFFTHDWDNENLHRWLTSVKQLQQGHINDNGVTAGFEYERNQPNEVILRLCILHYGFRNNNSDLLSNYNSTERKAMKELKKKIFKCCEGEENIVFNIIYVSIGFEQPDKTFAGTEQPIIKFLHNPKCIDVEGRVYKNFDDYLSNNTLNRGVMVFPRKGTYVVNANETYVQLECQETPSCNFTDYAKKTFQAIVMVAGTVVTAATLLTPMVSFTAPLLAEYAATVAATGSFWASAITYGSKALLITQKALQYQKVAQAIKGLQVFVTIGGIFTTTLSLIDKASHEQKVQTEILLLTTIILSQISSKISSNIAQNVRKSILDGKTLEEISKGYTKLQKALITLANLLPKLTSAASLCSAFINLWSNPNRSMQDYTQLCLSMFFFANVIMKPVTLAQVFDATEGQIINEIENKVKDPNAAKRLEQDLAENLEPQKRAYLIKNVYRIEDIDGYYQRMDKFSSTVEYTKDGFILNQNMPLSPDAYNSLGKLEIINQKLLAISKMPEGIREKEIEKMLKDYGCESLKDEATNMVNGRLDETQKIDLQKELGNLDKQRKDLLFEVSASYKNEKGTSYRDITKNVEREFCHGSTLEEWKEAKNILESRKSVISTEEYESEKKNIEENIKHAEKVREYRVEVDQKLKADGDMLKTAKAEYLVKNPDSEKLYDDLKKVEAETNDFKEAEKRLNNGKTMEEWYKEKAKLSNTPENQHERNICDEGIRKGKELREMQPYVKMEKAVAFLEENGLASFEEIQKQENQKLLDLQKRLAEAPKSEKNAINAEIVQHKINTEIREKAECAVFQKKINQEGGGSFLEDTRKFIQNSGTFNKVENITTVVDANLIKNNLEECFQNSNYQNIEINGVKVFENMNDMQLTKFSGYFMDVESAKEMTSASLALIKSNGCDWKGCDANDFGDGMKLLGQFVENELDKIPIEKRGTTDLSKVRMNLLQNISNGEGSDFNNAKKYFNDWNNRINELRANGTYLPYRTNWTAAAHAEKHSDQGFETKEKYLSSFADNLFKAENAMITTPSQNGLSTDTIFIGDTTTENRYTFGVMNTNLQTGTKIVTTMYNVDAKK